MRKLLLLGGSTQQIPAIKYANQAGYNTILCDYLPQNPGKKYANKFYCVSTTDKDAILEIAMKENIDGIVAYASDPAAPTAAYVAEKLQLPTNPYKSVDILAYKDKFRKFLDEYGFNCPKAKSYSSLACAKKEISGFTFPIMVKPTDSSGSKGVNKVENRDSFDKAFNIALNSSKSQKIIIEEFIVQDHEYMIGGDCFVINGKVEYWGLLNCHRDSKVNQLVPVGKSYPLLMSQSRINKVKEEIQKVFDKLQIKFGGFNIEAMIDRKENVFLIEIGPRNGGNMIPDFLKIISNVDLIEATVESSIGNKQLILEAKSNDYFYATHNIHTDKNGIFVKVNYKNNIKDKIINQVIYKDRGDLVQYFDAANKAIGIIFLKFKTQKEQMDFVSNPEQWIEVVVE